MSDLTALFGKSSKDQEVLEFRAFPKHGNPRWLLERRFRRPWYLKTWPRANTRAKIIYRVAWALSTVGVHLPSQRMAIAISPTSVYAELSRTFDTLGVFLGTPGPNRKIVVFAQNESQTFFVKVALTPRSEALIQNETNALSVLNADPGFNRLVPDSQVFAGHLAIESVETDGTTYASLALSEVARIHDLLFDRSVTCIQIRDLKRLCATINTSDSGNPKPVEQTFEVREAIARTRHAANLFLGSFPKNRSVDCYMAHGDFTRWNTLVATDSTARIIDWELFGLKPKFFDLVHYYVSADILALRRGPEEIMTNLVSIGAKLKTHYSNDFNWFEYVGLYFAIHSLLYCQIYEAQDDMPDIAISQLDIWSSVMAMILDHKFD